MGISKKNYFEFLEIVSSKSYGETIYSSKVKENGLYEVYIKDCCNNCIMELVKAGYNMEMCSKGLHVWKFED